MPSKSGTKSRKEKAGGVSTGATGKKGQVDIIFGGPLLFVPEVKNGNVTSVEVFSPRNGHPMGAVFLPEIWFSDADLNDPSCEHWPDAESLSLLDAHSYAIELTQTSKKKRNPFRVASIPDTNHKVKPGRRLSAEWDVAIAIIGQLSGWTSHRLTEVTEGLFHGSDAPTSKTVAGMHKLTYDGVTAATFFGAAKAHGEYLSANIAGGGTLVIMGEIPYHPSLHHERTAISALAKLAGLDFHLATTAPAQSRTRLMHHLVDCLNSIVLAEEK
jgi:hypothetical protein